MIKTITLRNKPELKCILDIDNVTIVDASAPKNNGIYQYSDIKKIMVHKEETNWFFSFITVIMDLFMQFGNGKKYTTKAYLTITLENNILKIWLNNANLQKAKEVTAFINRKIRN